MSEKGQLGTCDVLQGVKHPYDPFECRNWEPWEPVASPQVTFQETTIGSNSVNYSGDNCGEIENLEKCPTCNGYHAGGCHRAAQPAAGTTPRVTCNAHEGVHPYNVECKSPYESSEGTTPQAERQDESWRNLPIGWWFFKDSPECQDRYSVMERTNGGCTAVCHTGWHNEGAKKDMQSIAELHNLAVAPVQTPQFTEIKPVGSHIIDHPDLKRWLEQEPRYAEQRRDGLWIHYTAICTLLKSYAAQKTAPVETRLTAEQFADSDGWKFGAAAKQTAYRFAEEYSASWQRIVARLEAQNAGLREEIERLKGGSVSDLVIDICRELYDRFAMGGWEPQDAHRQVAEMLAPLQARAEAAEAEAAALRERNKFCFECEKPDECASAELCYAHQSGFPKK